MDYWQRPLTSASLTQEGLQVTGAKFSLDTQVPSIVTTLTIDYPIFLTIKQILFTEAYQRLMQINSPQYQIVPIRRFLLKEDS